MGIGGDAQEMSGNGKQCHLYLPGGALLGKAAKAETAEPRDDFSLTFQMFTCLMMVWGWLQLGYVFPSEMVFSYLVRKAER